MLDVLWMSVTKKEQLINCSIQLVQSSLDCTFARSFFCWFFSAIKRASNWRFPYFFVVVRTIASPCLCLLFSQSAIRTTCDSVRLCLSLSLSLTQSLQVWCAWRAICRTIDRASTLWWVKICWIQNEGVKKASGGRKSKKARATVTNIKDGSEHTVTCKWIGHLSKMLIGRRAIATEGHTILMLALYLIVNSQPRHLSFLSPRSIAASNR